MRICLVARNRFHNDRKALVTYRVLVKAGHEVEVVAVDANPPRDPVTVTVARRSGPPNRVGAAVDWLLPSVVTDRILQRRLTAACADTRADIFLPLHDDLLEAAVAAARRTDGVVQRAPGMPGAGDVDLITRTPAHPELSGPNAGLGTAYTPADGRAPYDPVPGRFRGEAAVLCYRKTEANPGRYIEAAMARSGLDVRVETDVLDLSTVDPGARFVLFVEGPHPVIEVSGSTSVPVLYWVHHGEHHIYPNLRLTDRYRADAVLLAHSWHLAHWFPTPVHRFPFAVASELMEPSRKLTDRRFDVAMVGSKLRGEAWQYPRRRQLVETLESKLPATRVRFVEGIAPEAMATLYGDSRIVLNEGGTRHYPITMRVFEAIGSGAALLTDPAPGLEVLIDPGLDYATLTDDPAHDVDKLLDDLEATQVTTDRALERARGHHTYDHRVDDLIDVAGHTSKREPVPSSTTTDLGRLIDGDVDVQRLVHDEVPDLADQLPDREVWALSERVDGRLHPAGMDAAVITSGNAAGMEKLLDTARRYIYAGSDVSGLEDYLESRHPDAVTEQRGRLRRIDLMAESYRASSAGSPR